MSPARPMRSLVTDLAFHLVHSWRFRRYLSRGHDVTGARPYRFRSWHLGTRYYLGRDRRTTDRLFIKNAPAPLVARELRGWHVLAGAPGGSRFLPRIVASDADGVYPFIAFERLDAAPLLDGVAARDAAASTRIAGELVELIDALDAARLIHRDLTSANLLVRRQADAARASIAVIDFACAIFQHDAQRVEELPLEALRTLGDGLNPAPFVWDDAYSALQVILLLEARGARLDAQRRALEERVGRRVHVHAH